MDIIEMTRELGRALQNDERYIAMMAARQATRTRLCRKPLASST